VSPSSARRSHEGPSRLRADATRHLLPERLGLLDHCAAERVKLLREPLLSGVHRRVEREHSVMLTIVRTLGRSEDWAGNAASITVSAMGSR
jgi:hypothetical protein